MPLIAELQFLEGPQAGEAIRLSGGALRVGRAQDCDVRVEDDFASRHHADLRSEGEAYVYVNVSPNGTRINGKSVKKRTLRDGDVIEIGSLAKLRFVVHAQPKAVIGHAPHSDEPLEDLLAEDEVEQVALRPAVKKPLLLQPKVLIPLGIYLMGVVGVGIWLAAGGLDSSAPQATFLTSEQLVESLQNERQRTLDPVLAQRWLVKANRLAGTALRNSNQLFAAYYAYKESLWHAGLQQFVSLDDQKQFEQIRDALIREVDGRYFGIVTSYKAGRWTEAVNRCQDLISMMDDYGPPSLPSFADHPLNENVRKIVAACRWHLARE